MQYAEASEGERAGADECEAGRGKGVGGGDATEGVKFHSGEVDVVAVVGESFEVAEYGFGVCFNRVDLRGPVGFEVAFCFCAKRS